ncbi:MAG: YqgE/AlgH family protein [Bryobacteraceae bacterium]|nr:YqgE/AlgH family protein [Bryobacteraceae bacterium]
MKPIILAMILAAAVMAQEHADPKDLAPGMFLIAARKLPDPNFSETVVLLTRHGGPGAMGLIINRKTQATLSRLMEDLGPVKAESATGKDPLYLGGPVGRSGVLALLRAKTRPAESRLLFSDVYLLTGKDQLRNQILAATGADTFRVYLGYSGWGPGQLEREVETGAWHILKADAKLVFDADPDSVWMRLIRRMELRFAGLGLRGWVREMPQ